MMTDWSRRGSSLAHMPNGVALPSLQHPLGLRTALTYRLETTGTDEDHRPRVQTYHYRLSRQQAWQSVTDVVT